MVLQLSTLFFFACKLSLSNLQVDFQDALLTRHILVHLMYLVQILFKVLRFLFELQIITRNAIFQLFISIFDLIELHFKFQYFFNAIQQVLVKLFLFCFVFGLEFIAFLLYEPLLHLYHVWLFLLKLLLDGLFELINFF